MDKERQSNFYAIYQRYINGDISLNEAVDLLVGGKSSEERNAMIASWYSFLQEWEKKS